eukprot:353244-Chlamydomonas_euryale.AAC.5
MTPSQIGVLLRDQHGIPMVGSVTGSKVLRILRGKGCAKGALHQEVCMSCARLVMFVPPHAACNVARSRGPPGMAVTPHRSV